MAEGSRTATIRGSDRRRFPSSPSPPSRPSVAPRIPVSPRTPVPAALLAALLAAPLALGCSGEREIEPPRRLVVTAAAYTSTPGQTDGAPRVAAWGDTLRPGMKAIAVSRDLLAEGLRPGSRVRIQGLRGEYVVADKMAARWRRRIDIYMGNDRRQALEWGEKQVEIRWRPVRPTGEGRR